jgi:hypothetical protein
VGREYETPSVSTQINRIHRFVSVTGDSSECCTLSALERQEAASGVLYTSALCRHEVFKRSRNIEKLPRRETEELYP